VGELGWCDCGQPAVKSVEFTYMHKHVAGIMNLCESCFEIELTVNADKERQT
jgi:hypothetical protein